MSYSLDTTRDSDGTLRPASATCTLLPRARPSYVHSPSCVQPCYYLIDPSYVHAPPQCTFLSYVHTPKHFFHMHAGLPYSFCTAVVCLYLCVWVCVFDFIVLLMYILYNSFWCHSPKFVLIILFTHPYRIPSCTHSPTLKTDIYRKCSVLKYDLLHLFGIMFAPNTFQHTFKCHNRVTTSPNTELTELRGHFTFYQWI